MRRNPKEKKTKKNVTEYLYIYRADFATRRAAARAVLGYVNVMTYCCRRPSCSVCGPAGASETALKDSLLQLAAAALCDAILSTHQ